MFLLLLRKVQWHSALPCKTKKKKRHENIRSRCLQLFDCTWELTTSWYIHWLCFSSHWQKALKGRLADMAWFYCFLVKCQRDSVSHTGQNSRRQKHTKLSKCVFVCVFFMSWILLQQTVSSCHNDPSQQRSPDLIWRRENLFSSATNSELQVRLNWNWADPPLDLVIAAATRGLYWARPASFAMP